MNSTINTRTVRKATYNDIGGPNGYLANKRPFVGNSMSARWEYNGDRMVYRVYSYHTDIATYYPPLDGADPSTQTRWYEDRYWSVTTSRHQNLCKAWL